MASKYYVTTAIPYVNADPHVGFALEIVQADAVARWHRMLGKRVYFQTGSDENSLKNVQAAEARGIPVRELCDANSARFAALKQALDLSNDAFFRTTSELHFRGASKLWSMCDPDDLYRRRYRGFYCVGCETFYTPKDLADGKCPEHKTEPEVVEEENYFFRLSRYQDRLERAIASDEYRVVPETRKNEILSFIRMGLEDFSVSRSAARARNWGIPVPGDPGQVMYVWFDALSNYVTGLGFADDSPFFGEMWPADLHVIGKGILRFHAAYWPAMLMSARLPLPKALFVHGYITVNGEKISKSLGNVIDPFSLADRYGADPLRYFLLRKIPPYEDGDFSIAALESAYDTDLANALGNLMGRITNMAERYAPGGVEGAVAPEGLSPAEKVVAEAMDRYDFRAALDEIFRSVERCNVYIEQTKPWALAKDPGRASELRAVLGALLAAGSSIARLLGPFLPAASGKIGAALAARPIRKLPPLFPRLGRGA
ncbi:MAG: methionine--tRNA ligase [Planctomycetota bacterium]|nr:methionine--tRNA ligase [Planctomycetota bacterium]